MTEEGAELSHDASVNRIQFKDYRIVDQSEITPQDSERIQRMADFMLRFTKNFSIEEREEILRGTDIRLEVVKKIEDQDGEAVLKEDPDRMLELISKDDRRLSRITHSDGETSVRLKFPSSGPVAKIEVPEGMDAQEVVDMYSASLEFQVMLTTKWLKDSEQKNK